MKIDIRTLMRKKDERIGLRMAIIDKAINGDRGYTNDEKIRTKALQDEIDIFDTQIKELEDLENQRAGIKPGQQEITPQFIDPGDSSRGTGSGDRFIDVNTGREVRTYLPHESLTEGREYNLPDGIKAEDLDLGRMVRGFKTGDWSGAEAEHRVQGTIDGSLGGFLLPEPLSDSVLQKMRNALRVSQAGGLTVKMDHPKMSIVKTKSEPTAHWVGEHQLATVSGVTLEGATLTAHKVIALIKTSEEMLFDAPNFGSMVEDLMAKALAERFDKDSLYGDGVDRPLGIYGTDGVTKVSLATTPHIDDFITGIFSLVGKNFDQKALAAIYNADTGKTLAKLKDSTSGLYLEDSSPEAWKKLKKLLTAQIVTGETTSAVTEVFLGDFRHVLLGLHQGVTLASIRGGYDEASTQGLFMRGDVFLRASMRVDSLVVRPDAFYVMTDVGV